ncbi:MAG: P1 family peptidase [Asgard group archaeon]|nr:P1 family peptidase [Asgard group archaeon]
MLENNDKTRCRFRDLGFSIGDLETGKRNSISDVPGVKVGHCTIIEGNGKLIPGEGPIRTGVTIIIPHEGNIYREKVRASSFILNGYGKTTGLVQVEELGTIESYIGLTNTLNIPLVTDALIDYHLEENPDIGISTSSINVVVGECNDGYLNDIQGRHVKKEHVLEAIDNASVDVDEGCVGAGTGMVTYGYKGGIGTSSRIIKTDNGYFVIGVLVLANFGHRNDLTIAGKKIHQKDEAIKQKKDHGSVMVIIATNAPLNSRQLFRITKRAPMGLARTGSFASWGSGDIMIAFSTANKINHNEKDELFDMTIVNETSKLFNGLLKATVEATEEAVLNALCKAITMKGRDDHIIEAFPYEKISS